MMNEEINKQIRRLESMGAKVNWIDEHGQQEVEILYGDSLIMVKNESSKWIGLTFYINKDSKHELQYSIDTDLYDLSDPSNEEFVTEIINDITDFLKNLADNEILINERARKPEMIVPLHGGFMLIKKGLFSITYKRVLRNKSEIKNIKDFTRLQPE